LIEAVAITSDELEKHWEVLTVPIKEAAPRSLAHSAFPRTDVIQRLVPGNHLSHFSLSKDKALRTDQVHAVSHHSLPNRIVAALVAVQNGHDQLEEVVLVVSLDLHGVDLLQTLLKDFDDEFADVSVDQHHPFVY